MKDYLVLACEALKAEIDYLVSHMDDPPEIIFLENELHNEPDKLRATLQAKIDELENTRPEIKRIAMVYGLCGRAFTGVSPSRVQLIVPRVHDCIPLYLGLSQEKANKYSHEGGILWLSAGALEYTRLPKHLVYERHTLYRDKYGEKRAERMIKAENAVFSNYGGACFIRWPELASRYQDFAQKVAAELSLKYTEMAGETDFLLQILSGGDSGERFLVLNPGETLDMDKEGRIVSRNTELQPS